MSPGNPSNATADTTNHKQYLIKCTMEAMAYNDNTPPRSIPRGMNLARARRAKSNPLGNYCGRFMPHDNPARNSLS